MEYVVRAVAVVMVAGLAAAVGMAVYGVILTVRDWRRGP
jgi:hypothetical protein